MVDLTQLLQERFPSEYTDPLVSIVKRAYRANSDCHDPILGHDEMSFGLLVHKSIKRFVSDLAEKEKWLDVSRRAPRFLFKINDCPLSAYRVGDPLESDPNESFPKNRTGAWILAAQNKRQLSFAFINDAESEWDETTLPALILAHVGRFETGLNCVFLGVPSDFNDKNEITEWKAHRVLWRSDGEALTIPVVPTGGIPPKAPVETVSPPVLSLNKVEKVEGEK